MTIGELILLRKFSQGVSDLAHLPVEVIKMIIRHLNIRAMLAYKRRRSLPRYLNLDYMDPMYYMSRTHEYVSLYTPSTPGYTTNYPFYGPGH